MAIVLVIAMAKLHFFQELVVQKFAYIVDIL